MRSPSSSQTPLRALEEARAVLDDALARTPDDPALLLLRARADVRLQSFETAGAFFERAARLFRERGDPLAEASAALETAQTYAKARDLHKVRTFHQRAITVYTDRGDTHAVAKVRVEHAVHLVGFGQWADAERQLKLALDPLALVEDWEVLGHCHELLMSVARRNGEHFVALDRARDSVECAAKAKDRRQFGLRLALLSTLHHEAANWTKSRQYQEKAQPHLRGTGEWLALLDGYDRLIDVASLDGDFTGAEALLAEAVMAADEMRKPGIQGRLRARWASIKLGRSEAAGAVGLLVTAVEQLAAAGDPRASAPAFADLGRCHVTLGNLEEAKEAFGRAEQLWTMLGEKPAAAAIARERKALG